MSILDKPTATQLDAGLNKDFTFKPSRNTTFVLNGIRDSHDGGKFQYQSEPGNELVTAIPTGNTICGWIYGQNNEIYLLSYNAEYSEIGIFKNGTYNTEVQVDLGFDPRYPITGEYKLRNGCERVIYWCDGQNPDYFYNFDRPELFKDSIGDWDPNKFRLVPVVLPPVIDLERVNDGGGNIPLGSLYFQVEILDNTLNTIYKSDITPQVIIVDDSTNDSYNSVDGGLNIAQYTEESGGVPTSSKSVTLRFSNLNTSFGYLRVNVARQIAGNQVIDAHAVGSLIPIGAESFVWTYTGYNVSNGDYPIDYNEMLSDNIRYDTSYVMEQVQNRLVRASLKQQSRDYSTYQRVASSVEVRWVCEEVLNNTITELGNAKNPHTYWLKTSLQGDEVVALGIQFLHDDGIWSPYFHIPGRTSQASDVTVLTVVDNAAVLGTDEVWESDVQHLDELDFVSWVGTYVGSTVYYWKVFNSAVVTDNISLSHPYSFEGKMGYYEGSTTYPEVNDCDGNLIWGQDSNGVDIDTNTLIRHHRVPDRDLMPVVSGDDGEYIRPIGLKFYNINYPDGTVIGHRFGYAVRDDFNKTVLDSGWFGKVEDNEELSFTTDDSSTIYGISSRDIETTNYEAGDPTQVTGQYGVYCSANVLFNQKLFTPSYLKFNRAYNHEYNGGLFGDDPLFPFGVTVDRTGGGSIGVAIYHIGLKNSPLTPYRHNYTISNQVFVPENGFITASAYDVAIENKDSLSPINVIKTDYELENYNNEFYNGWWIPYVYKKTTIKPFESLFNLNYKYLHLNYETSGDADDNIYYGGDTIIALSAPTKHVAGNPDEGVYAYAFSKHMLFFEEHQFNPELRHAGTIPAYTYYKADGNYNVILDKIASLQDDGTYEPYMKSEIIAEGYNYNIDYDKQHLHNTTLPLPITYNYCSHCIGYFDTRLVFSPKSFDEETFDLYRINKINDYIDLPGYRGQITGLKYKNNLILVHCKEGTFILQPNPQAITTNLSEVYLTTGDFLGIPPSEIMQTDIGFAGCQSKQHQCDTPHGWCWVDQLRGTIFSFDTRLEELSNKGLEQWFNENLPSELKFKFYQVFLTDYTIESTLAISNNGIGLILFYDPKFDRLFVSKKDFLPISFSDRVVNTGDVAYDFETGRWVGINGVGETVVVEFNDPDFFENKSWTLSYSFAYNQEGNLPWTSWHSYIPPFAFWDNIYYYTMPVTDGDINYIYRHNHQENYQNYYGVKNSFIVEWMDYGNETRDFNGIHYIGYTLQWNDTHKQWVQINDTTFNTGLFYTFNQSTGYLTLSLNDQHNNPYGNLNFNNVTRLVTRTDNNYKINKLFDISTNSPVVTSSWDNIKDDYFIDLVPYEANLNYDATPYELANIRDKFLISRLYFNPEQDYKKVINLIQNQDSISIR